MENATIKNQQISYSQVYIDNIAYLVKSYLELNNLNKVDRNFGLPIVQFSKDKKVLGFASLVLNEEQKIKYKIFDLAKISTDEQSEISSILNNYIEEKQTGNFKNPEQLGASIESFIFWMNS
ncbi:hypothetical protein [Soonwooa sp.]|uniref:hypothetical protein n=1 Tax=Soonwooa sp. TaxID=1938592 RepID=UPI0026050815|nr:hypothetical protein [Soonwooa sp.]